MDWKLKTERLVLTPYQAAYLEDYYREFSKEILRYQYPDPFPDLETANQVLSGFVQAMERGDMLELAVLASAGEFLGSVEAFGLREETPELGIWLKSAAQGMGYGYEALRAVVDYLNGLKKYRHYIYEADVRNAPSLRLAEKFQFEKGERQEVITDSGKELILQAYHIFA